MGIKTVFFAFIVLVVMSVALGKKSRRLQAAPCPPSVTVAPVYRYWNGKEHFYTMNKDEIGVTVAGQKGRHGYTSEGIAFYAVQP